MRILIIGLAALALGACETMPEFLQPAATTTNAPAATPAPAPAAAPATFTPPPEQQLLELERQLQAAAQARGLGAALGEAIDADYGMVIRPGQAYQGVDEVTRGLGTAAGSTAIFWQPDRVHVARAGDMGVTSGRYAQLMSASESVQGRYVMVWRRNAEGQWKVLTETRVPDPPRPAARRR
ncbi:hypothetical protein U91I_01102 [alpha proteobacterium U9-1i]|nr:hypothetical protein U91I_01102 [alpha proteobacterium U9-1i]